MAETKLKNLVNPEVMADMISGKLTSKIQFASIAKIDTTLEGQAGDTITVPKYAYIGDADDVAEGLNIIICSTIFRSCKSITSLNSPVKFQAKSNIISI